MKDARYRFLKAREAAMLTPDDLELIKAVLLDHLTLLPGEKDDEKINYESYLDAKQALPPHLRSALPASLFVRLQKDPHGRVCAASVFHVIRSLRRPTPRALTAQTMRGLTGCL
jgi:hypothetical protein